MISKRHHFNNMQPQISSKLDEARQLLIHKTEGNQTLLAQGNALIESLAHLEVDTATQITGLLLPAVESGRLDYASITHTLGSTITKLLQGIERLGILRHYHSGIKSPTQTEKLRKMLLAIVEDPRVVLIGLADHLYRLRSAKNAAEITRQILGQETLDIFAPLANRLGIWQLKWELEDLALYYLEPKVYKKLAKALNERRADREQYIAQIKEQLRNALARENIYGEINGRPKHLYSIWKKMQAKNLDFHQLFDVHAFRVIVEDVNTCYAALSVVHTLWQPISKEFNDYIIHPKPNGYRSLHTAVIDSKGKPMEVQIRSFQMHQESELGIAAHWRYKEGTTLDKGFEQRIAWLRAFLDQKGGNSANNDIIEQFKSKAFHNRIYVLTPRGQVIDLPEGATPLDFAYAIHTQVGHRCRGAKVDGVITTLTQPLTSGQQVEILTTREANPSRDWLNARLGYLHTSIARAKIQRWFKQQDYSLHITRGRALLEREQQRVGLAEIDFKPLLKRFHHHHSDNLLAALGCGDISANQLHAAMREQLPKTSISTLPAPSIHPVPIPPVEPAIQILGVNNLLSRLARCCNPISADKIIGYLTHGGGITIHRYNCSNITKLPVERQNRLVEITWHNQVTKK